MSELSPRLIAALDRYRNARAALDAANSEFSEAERAVVDCSGNPATTRYVVRNGFLYEIKGDPPTIGDRKASVSERAVES